MYEIYADGICIYSDISPLDELKVANPKLTLEDSAAGSLTMTLPPTNAGYHLIQRMTTDISVLKNGEEIWAGRVLTEDRDFWNNRILTCEGELAFLNDSTQPPAEYHDVDVRPFLETLIGIHNAKVAENRRFTVGAVTVTDPNNALYRYTNFEKTIECINDKLINRLGGHMRVRKENGVRYLDYLADGSLRTSTQHIEFGKNLLEFTTKWDTSEFATVIVPLGERQEESPIEALEAYLTVESVNDGSIYVKASDEVLAEYGWIEKVVHWDDMKRPIRLLRKAERYLQEIQFDNMEIELSAIDLSYMDVDYDDIELLDEVFVTSPPHGLERYFPVKKLEIPLDSPENTQFKLGDSVKVSLTSVNNKTNTDILNKIESLPSFQSVMDSAIANATAIMNMKTTGYITILTEGDHSKELRIHNNIDPSQSSKYWRWSMDGLGYTEDGGTTYKMALTNNGAIVADSITSGVLNANYIKAGVLKSINDKSSFDLTTGELTCTIGNIGGYTISANGISNNVVSLGNSGMGLVNTGTNVGIIGTNSWVNYPNYKGLIFGLEYDGSYMMWGRKIQSTDTAYTAVLTYAKANAGAGFDYEGLYFDCDMYCRSHTAYNLYLDPNTSGASGGITGTMNFVKVVSVNSDGTLNTWSNGCTMEFKNGMLVNATF